MDVDEAEREVARILTADVASLARGRGVKPPSAGESWDVPAADRAALWLIGLPPPREDEYYGVVGAFQEGTVPELDGLYRIGHFGEARLGMRPGTGTVITVPKYTEVHPQLRELYPHGIGPCVVNSAVRLPESASQGSDRAGQSR